MLTMKRTTLYQHENRFSLDPFPLLRFVLLIRIPAALAVPRTVRIRSSIFALRAAPRAFVERAREEGRGRRWRRLRRNSRLRRDVAAGFEGRAPGVRRCESRPLLTDAVFQGTLAINFLLQKVLELGLCCEPVPTILDDALNDGLGQISHDAICRVVDRLRILRGWNRHNGGAARKPSMVKQRALLAGVATSGALHRARRRVTSRCRHGQQPCSRGPPAGSSAASRLRRSFCAWRLFLGGMDDLRPMEGGGSGSQATADIARASHSSPVVRKYLHVRNVGAEPRLWVAICPLGL